MIRKNNGDKTIMHKTPYNLMKYHFEYFLTRNWEKLFPMIHFSTNAFS